MGGRGTRPYSDALGKGFMPALLPGPVWTATANAAAIRPPESVRLAILLRVEALGVHGAGRRDDTGKNRQSEHDRNDDLHGVSPFIGSDPDNTAVAPSLPRRMRRRTGFHCAVGNNLWEFL